MRMEKAFGWFIACLAVIGIVVFAFIYTLFAPPVYETNDLADYGVVKGNYDNERPKEFVSSFFPEKIEDTFSDVTYHYKAKKFDTSRYALYRKRKGGVDIILRRRATLYLYSFGHV